MTDVLHLPEFGAALLSVTAWSREFAWCVIDANLAPALARYTWYVERAGYPHPTTRIRLFSGRMRDVRLHRLLTHAKDRQWVIHRNGNTLDCRHENLRLTGNHREAVDIVEKTRASKSSYLGALGGKEINPNQ